MCFSAGASFGAGIILSAISVVTFRKVQSPGQMMFSCIPMIFAIQQISEGFLWLSLTRPDFAYLQPFATYIFLSIAQILWPVWVPWSVLKLEPPGGRSLSLRFFTLTGVCVSLFLAYCLFTFPVEAKISTYHISYLQKYPANLSKYCLILYILATVTPSFISHIKWMWILGLTILISYLITYIFYTDYIVSVWCFFASVISIAVYIILPERSHSIWNDVNPKLKELPGNTFM